METIYLKVVEDFDVPRLDLEIGRMIYQAVENKLRVKPFLYGFPLHGKLRKFRKFRVGDYRLIYTVSGNKIIVVAIGHRKEIYKLLERRV